MDDTTGADRGAESRASISARRAFSGDRGDEIGPAGHNLQAFLVRAEPQRGGEPEQPQQPQGVGHNVVFGYEPGPGVRQIVEPSHRVDDASGTGRPQGHGQSIDCQVPASQVGPDVRGFQGTDIQDQRPAHKAVSDQGRSSYFERVQPQRPAYAFGRGPGGTGNGQVIVLHRPAKNQVPHRSSHQPDRSAHGPGSGL